MAMDAIKLKQATRKFVEHWTFRLRGADISTVRSCPEIMERIRKVREFRLASRRESTLRSAGTPALFGAPVELSQNYVALPKVSSENRLYIPIDYLPAEVIPGDKLFVMPNATPYHFGVLTSSVHMAWMRAVCGRMKSDYSYSNTIVYNNFPWPANPGNPVNPVKNTSADSAPQRLCVEKITVTAQTILDARAKYPKASFADLYDPNAMHLAPELVAAHEANDRAVLAAYGLAPDTSEPEIVANLFRLYAEKSNTTSNIGD